MTTRRILQVGLIALLALNTIVLSQAYPGQAARLAAVPQGITQGLVSCWEMDEESGTRYDAYGANHLTDNNTVGFVGTGKIGKASSFVAANSEYLSIAHNSSVSLATNATVIAWLYPTNNERVISKGSTMRVRLISNAVQVLDGSAATVADLPITLSTWSFVAVAYSGSTTTLRINSSTDSGTYTLASNTDPLYIGWNGATSYYGGYMDIVAIWSRALSTDELNWLYNAGSGKSCADIIAADAATPTPTVTHTPLPPTPDTSQSTTIQLSHGQMVVNRTVTYGDIFVVVALAVLLLVLVVYVLSSVIKRSLP
jgi:hypothetical protein